MESRHILIVANQTAGGEHLKKEVRRRIEEGPCRFTLLVPATAPQGPATWDEGDAFQLADRRMQAALESLRGLGAEIEGLVGDELPVDAIGDVLRKRKIDEIILSTLPAGASRWLKQDLLHRVERRYKLPVTHIVAAAESSPIG